jgi:hypothetical protein
MPGGLAGRGRAVFALASLMSFAFACRKTPAPPRPSASPSPRVGITWVDPPGLHRVPPADPTQRARYLVPRAAGDPEDGELAVFHFDPGQGDGIDANMNRWVASFTGVDPGHVKRVEREANGLRLHTVEIARGTFEGAQTKKDYALEGASVEGPGGAYLFKMTGPAPTIAARRPAFLQLLDSMHIVRADH